LCSITQLYSITPFLRSTLIPLPSILLPCSRGTSPLLTASFFFFRIILWGCLVSHPCGRLLYA
jgi:hypothetical protein